MGFVDRKIKLENEDSRDDNDIKYQQWLKLNIMFRFLLDPYSALWTEQ